MIRLYARSFRLPKAGNRADECEDAYFPKVDGALAGETLKFSVADGSTEGMLSAEWATYLTRAFDALWREPSQLNAWLVRTLQLWVRWKERYLKQRAEKGRPVQWYEEPGLAAGAFAAFLGLRVTAANGSSPAWQAVAIGDACLFQLRDGKLISCFPVADASDFGSRPVLFSSNPSRNGRLFEHLRLGDGSLLPGDTLLLMTDALAAWFLAEAEEGRAPWLPLLELVATGDGALFARWIDELRAAGEMRNDDVTLTCLQVLE